MLIVPMNRNGPLSNGFTERNHYVQDMRKQISDGVMGESQGLSQEDESRLNEDNKDENDEGAELVQVQAYAQAVIQKPEQQSQGPLVHWERFLPLPSLKVLLVESDDSTRHVVCALLRNCGYEVMAVANGLQAWKLLEDLTIHIDLVLTEVVMARLSGIGLLSKIMSHKTHKNIPVIMMSSHDCMNIVFKCLSKGAVDFLVKPIRKNELKNLWQHVWRKCHSASGSGSENAVPTQKSTKSRSSDESDNNTGSDDEDDNGSISLNARDGSDNGSGTQGSWTKRAVEVDRPKATSPWNQLSDPPDSTCTQVIHSRPEECDKNGVPTTIPKEHEEQDDEHDNVVMGKDLEIGVPKVPNLQLKDPKKKVLVNIAGNNGEKFPEIKSNREGGLKERKQPELNSERCNAESRNQDDNVNGVIANITDSQMGSVGLDIANGPLSDTKKEAIYENKEMPSLELSLKRFGDPVVSAHDRNVLIHSGLSAFSRYNSDSTASQAPIENVGSCSPLDNSSEAAKTETTQKPQFNSSSTNPNQNSNGSGNDNDMGSSTDNAFMKPMVMSDEPARHSTVKYLYYSSAFHPVQNNNKCVPQPIKQGKGDAAIANMNQQVQVQCHHHYYDHHHYHVHNMPKLQQLANHDNLSVKNKAVAASKCGSSNMMSTTIEGNAGNFSLDGSASGSDQGSNGQNGSGIILNPRGTTIDGNNGVAGEGGTGGRIGFGGRTSVGQNHFALREAALNKFRQKRKERCFEKKVRYQSRKKLAEQRPRVRGQFVRQVANERKDTDPRC